MTAALTRADAERMAHEWVEAFNAHDVERILSHYAESIELTSRLVMRVVGDPEGTVRGKAALRAYFGKALAAAPHLRFELLEVFVGVRSVAVHVRSNVRGLQLEVMELDGDGHIARVTVHHRDPVDVR
jgi:ketosteroid isomerase-like protein